MFFFHDAAYPNSKDSAKWTALDKFFKKKKAYEISINPKYDGYQRGIAYILYDKKTGSGACVNTELPVELWKAVIKN